MLSKTALEIYDLLNAFCFSFFVELTNTSRVEPFLIWFDNAKYIFLNKYPPKLGLKNYLLKIKWKVSSDGWQLDTHAEFFFYFVSKLLIMLDLKIDFADTKDLIRKSVIKIIIFYVLVTHSSL